MDDKDIFVALEANIIEAVKRLVQNARTEFNSRAQKAKGATAPAAVGVKPVPGGVKAQPVKTSTTTTTAAKPADATPKKEVKEPGNMMDVFNSILPVAEETPSSEPALTTTVEGETQATPAEPTLTAEEEAKRQFDDLAMDVDGELHGMKHMTAERPKQARRKTHAGTASKFDPHAAVLPEPVPVVVALVPDEQERKAAQGPRQPVVNLGDLQKRGGARAGGPGRGGAQAVRRETTGNSPATSPNSDTPPPEGVALRNQKSVEGVPRPGPTSPNKSDPHPPPKAPELPKEPATPPPPAEPAKLPDLPPEEPAHESPQVVVSPETEAPPLPSLPAAPLSPLWTLSAEPAEPEHLSLEPVVRKNSGVSAPPIPALPSDTAPQATKPGVASPKPPAGRPGPAPPPGAPHHHVPGPAPPPGRATSPAPRKISTGAPPTPQSPASPQPLDVQEGETPPPIPSTPTPVEGEGAAPPPEQPAEPEKKISAVMSAARAKQPAINLADITKPRTPKADGVKPAAAPAAPAGPAVPKCAECGCNKFVMNPFKKGTNCSTCFHVHPAPG